MKYKDYQKELSDLLTKVMDENKCFFAFGQAQFDEQKEEGVKYVQLGNGMLIPKDNMKSFNDAYTKGEKEIKAKRKDLDRKKVIAYELNNHEAYYTGDIYSTMEILKDIFSDITEEEVREVYKENQHKFDY